MWPDRRLADLLGIEHPIIQAPMAGPTTPDMVAAVSAAGGLGSLAAAMQTPEQTRTEILIIRQRTDRPINVNFFCHTSPAPDAARDTAWRAKLAPYYRELGVDPASVAAGPARLPFGEAACQLMEELRPKVASFHFGLPAPEHLRRLKAAGIILLASATTVAEARWLETQGVDAIVAQGAEAGGHRGMFLTTDIAAQPGTMALVPEIVDAVRLPVIAAGGIGDARGIAAAFMLGAAAAQLGTAYLFCPEAKLHPAHRQALKSASADATTLTNVFTGRPARGIQNRLIREVGPISPDAPAFPNAAGGVAPLRAAAEATGSGEFTPLWSGQAASLGREMTAGDLTRHLAAQAQALLKT